LSLFDWWRGVGRVWFCAKKPVSLSPSFTWPITHPSRSLEHSSEVVRFQVEEGLNGKSEERACLLWLP